MAIIHSGLHNGKNNHSSSAAIHLTQKTPNKNGISSNL